MLDHTKKADAVKLLGRILLSIIFIVAGYGKIGAFAATVAWVASAGLPFPELITVLAIILEVGGGLMLLVGWKTRYAALSLAVFSVLAALIFHANFADPAQSGQFMKNLAIAGGLLYVKMCGAGAYSLDEKVKKTSGS